MLNKDVAATILSALVESKYTNAPYYQNAVNLMGSIAEGDTIADLWSVEDVQEAANMEYGIADDDVTPNRVVELDTARAALEMASNKMDANNGINWDWLQYCLDSVEGE